MSIDWPSRTPLEAGALAAPADGLVLNRHPWLDRSRTPWIATVREEPISVLWTRAAGVGVVRAITSAGEDRTGTGGDPDASEAGTVPGTHAGSNPAVTRLVFVSSWTRETPVTLATFPEPEGEPAWGPVPEGPGGPVVDRHWGVRMRYRPAAPGREARGVLVHLHGLGGHGLERAVQRPFREAGWAVLECIYPLANWSRVSLEVADPAARKAASAWLADVIDNRFGELAYAAEAALEALAARGDPAAAAGPVLITSFSAGGNAAPAVAARLGDRVQAMATVVAGADLMRISVLSSLGDTGLDVRRDGRARDRRRLHGGELEALSRPYLEQVRLDGWAVGPRLRNLPVLLVLGRFDAIVPASTGRNLRARLGEPETWWVPGGHVGTYVSLGWIGPRIGRWLLARHEEAVAVASGPGAVVAADAPDAPTAESPAVATGSPARP